MTISLEGRQYGLTNERQTHVHRLLQQYDHRLSLRRVDERDPAFNPQKPYGVYEEATLGQRPWVFFCSDTEIDDRLLARIAEADMVKHGVPEKKAKMDAFNAAQALSKQQREADQAEERRDEMMTIGELAQKHDIVRHRLGPDGELMRIGDTITSGRTFIV